jgi:MFS family permease
MTGANHQPPISTGHPVLFAVLLFPFGALSGYVGVVLAYDFAQSGISTEAIAVMVAIALVPNTWKFLWAPVVDTTLSPRIWYVGSALVTGLAIAALGAVPPNASSLVLTDALVFASSLAATFNGMTADALAARCAPDAKKGSYGGWLQVGNLAGSGIGGGAALWLGQVLPARWMAAALLGLSFVLCALALRWIPVFEPTSRDGHIVGRIVDVGRDAWRLARTRAGALAILVLFLPMGTGAVSNLFSAVADDWHASVDTVAMVNGALSGIAAGLGCLVGGHFCDRMDRKLSYCVFGLLQAACAVAMGIAPRVETSYIVFTVLYAVTSGLTYASFSALTLEAIGLGAAATKYTLLASLSNIPIQYMTLLEGRIRDVHGVVAMLFAEAGICVAAVVIFLVVARLTAI